MDTQVQEAVPAAPASDSMLLSVKDVYAGYDESMILKGVSIDVPEKKAVALLGRNGVGKTTLLNTILGIVATKAGSIDFTGRSIEKMAPDVRARLGIGYVPQGRDIFPGLTVWENLNVSLRVANAGKDAEARLESVYELFPVLKDMLKRKGGVLSGGQQQQLAIGRALLLKPKLLILDEPTEGIQPSIIDQIEDAIYAIRKKGEMSVILVEQYIDFARNACESFYILERGSVVQKGEIAKLDDDMVAKYLTV
ncbi:urea ABC transporter ATP-binding subunit UrtE [Pelagicoccus enzymogenes]|uniref:urea ABC transporter ATP-binding subunit UrtE n=1 Tax=Pelagicoccus enzymogenes TaxID=2773457 RepID=UPI00281048A7|nr:urea ABC transporter ATP-binding subunit UrtE [Pelagicoccus enzymogenes]MDQ8196513.1 urea ABC transporter ATP-binding subunit UrtE [Pelagicoccus enzymogenes]